MDTFYSTASHNFTIDENEETFSNTDLLSIKMNRSRMLLSEFGNDSTNLFKSSPSHYQQQQQQHQQLNESNLLFKKNQPQTQATGDMLPSEFSFFKRILSSFFIL
jgi:hypothetical protein